IGGVNMVFDVKDEKVYIYDLEEIDISNFNEFKKSVISFIPKPGIKTIILNFEKMNYIDSAGVGCIISIIKEVKRSNKKLIVTGLNKRIEKIFKMTGLESMVEFL
ncbi:MAG TPA: STAS domain-containing protein, partial [Tepiditoga sp.]|nr:STAS domain-containing protein [Tepiditoga sp.]